MNALVSKAHAMVWALASHFWGPPHSPPSHFPVTGTTWSCLFWWSSPHSFIVLSLKCINSIVLSYISVSSFISFFFSICWRIQVICSVEFSVDLLIALLWYSSAYSFVFCISSNLGYTPVHFFPLPYYLVVLIALQLIFPCLCPRDFAHAIYLCPIYVFWLLPLGFSWSSDGAAFF